MAADVSTVTSRVTEVLNACAAGTFSSTIASGYLDRNASAISEAVREGALMIASTILSNPNHVHRGLFVSGTATALTHGGELPDMAGENDLVEIKPYSSGTFAPGTPRTVQQIISYRDNPSNLYSTLSHTTQNSPLGGYYAIAQGRIYFTGFGAQIYAPAIDRTTVTDLIPDEYEPTWVCLAVGLTPKEGDNMLNIAQYFYQMGIQNLAQIASMGTVQPMPTIAKALEARGDS